MQFMAVIEFSTKVRKRKASFTLHGQKAEDIRREVVDSARRVAAMTGESITLISLRDSMGRRYE